MSQSPISDADARQIIGFEEEVVGLETPNRQPLRERLRECQRTTTSFCSSIY